VPETVRSGNDAVRAASGLDKVAEHTSDSFFERTKMIAGVPEGWELVRIGRMAKGDWAIGGDGKPWEYIRDTPGDEHWPVIRKVEPGRIASDEDELAARTDLIHQITKTMREERDQARMALWEAVSKREWTAIAGLAVLFDRVDSLSKFFDGMVERFSRE
jgi:hypothetical protein